MRCAYPILACHRWSERCKRCYGYNFKNRGCLGLARMVERPAIYAMSFFCHTSSCVYGIICQYGCATSAALANRWQEKIGRIVGQERIQ